MERIIYREGYKYQLADTYSVQVDIFPMDNINTDFLILYDDGLLTIREGYAWDGASGPAIDTKNFMRGSLVHDALYQLMRLGLLRQEQRDAADILLRKIVREDGMSAIRAWWVYWGVRIGGAFSATPDGDNPILEAP